MNIALVGYGKMGKIIEEVAISRGHQVNVKIDLNNLNDFNADVFSDVDVAIEFTGPHTAFNNVMKCIEIKKPVVCGSTGWLDQLPVIEQACAKNNSAFLYASNFSVGVNIFFEINKHLAKLMSEHTQYDVSIHEIHHTQKKDAPSGTAITLAEQVIQNHLQKKSWVNSPNANTDEISVTSERIDPYPGWHGVTYQSAIDELKIIHNAHNRNGFALGAVLAAEFIKDKNGIFTMKDVLGFGN